MSSTTTTTERVPAESVQVGDLVGTTRTDSRTKVESDGIQVARITEGPGGRVQMRREDGSMIRSCEPTTKLWRARTGESTETPETPQETTPVETTPETPKSAGYDWPRDPQLVLVEYLTERVSADHDAPTRYLPTVTAGVLRVHPSDWTTWLVDQGMPAPKKQALAVLKDAGLVQKVYALPGTDGKSAGFYTGAVPAGAGQLPERVVQRSQGRPRSPFGRLTDAQRALLVKALGKLNAASDRELRDQLLTHLEPGTERAA